MEYCLAPYVEYCSLVQLPMWDTVPGLMWKIVYAPPWEYYTLLNLERKGLTGILLNKGGGQGGGGGETGEGKGEFNTEDFILDSWCVWGGGETVCPVSVSPLRGGWLFLALL